jgi:hypothetical protein
MPPGQGQVIVKNAIFAVASRTLWTVCEAGRPQIAVPMVLGAKSIGSDQLSDMAAFERDLQSLSWTAVGGQESLGASLLTERGRPLSD